MFFSFLHHHNVCQLVFFMRPSHTRNTVKAISHVTRYHLMAHFTQERVSYQRVESQLSYVRQESRIPSFSNWCCGCCSRAATPLSTPTLFLRLKAYVKYSLYFGVHHEDTRATKHVGPDLQSSTAVAPCSKNHRLWQEVGLLPKRSCSAAAAQRSGWRVGRQAGLLPLRTHPQDRSVV